MMRVRWIGPVILLLCLGITGAVLAQTEACPAIVEQALTALDTNCGDLNVNGICYGHSRVEAAFTTPQPVGFFSLPGDRALVTALDSVRSGPLNLDSGDWGIAVLKIQADVPEASPGQGVIFLLLGETRVTNAVSAADAETLSPAQAFYFSTGLGTPACQETPSLLAIRTPEGTTVNLSVNGASIQVGSTLILRTTVDSEMVMTVVEGAVTAVDGVVTQSGETRIANLDAGGNFSSWEAPRPATDAELEMAGYAQNALAALSGEEVSAADEPVYHIVQPGENLFRIALRYNTSLAEIAQANNISNIGLVFVGQRLLIPNPGSGFVNLPQPRRPIVCPTTSGC